MVTDIQYLYRSDKQLRIELFNDDINCLIIFFPKRNDYYLQVKHLKVLIYKYKKIKWS